MSVLVVLQVGFAKGTSWGPEGPGRSFDTLQLGVGLGRGSWEAAAGAESRVIGDPEICAEYSPRKGP